MPPAPIPAGASANSAIGALLAGGSQDGADDGQARLQALASRITSLGQDVDAIASDFPMAAQSVALVKQGLKRIMLDAASAVRQSSASSQAVPTGASMGPSPV